ncbi:MAG: glycosyltransferase, partial [Gammaproteobacteria bacterium]|nr:glycosyltransferase [Gammaproteobacteria bacterium]
MPKFFFITICWNNFAGLRATIDSLLMQSCREWECIIVDGNSSDGTSPYLDSLVAEHSNITVISEPDKGIYDAMN